jgi:hypothetical protein
MMTSESKDQNMLQCRIRRSTSVVELLCYLYNQVYTLCILESDLACGTGMCMHTVIGTL